jgi:ATP-binding cassette subfamily F protein uup
VEKEKSPEKVVKKKKKTVALSFDEKREFGGLEAEIERLQRGKATIESEFLNVEIPTEEIAAKSLELETIIKKLEQKEERWLELSLKLEG